MDTYERIKEMCEDRGVTVSELEVHVGLGKKTMYNWKRSSPSAESLQKVAAALRVSPDYLLGKTAAPNKYGAQYGFTQAMDMDANLDAHNYGRPVSNDIDDDFRSVYEDLEMLHKNPKWRVLLSKGQKLDDAGIDAVIAIVERMTNE